MLAIGTLIAMAGLMVTVPAMAAEEGLGPVGAFRRSWNLTNGAKGHVFGILLVLFVVAGLLNSVLVIGPASLVEVWLDGTRIGTTPIEQSLPVLPGG